MSLRADFMAQKRLDEEEKEIKTINQLKAKNEELKKRVDDLLHKPEIQDKILWKIDNEALLGSKDAYIYKLEKILTEIKTDILYIREGISYFWVIDKCDKILQKISEVEEQC